MVINDVTFCIINCKGIVPEPKKNFFSKQNEIFNVIIIFNGIRNYCIISITQYGRFFVSNIKHVIQVNDKKKRA
jgi:hypothetical protein